MAKHSRRAFGRQSFVIRASVVIRPSSLPYDVIAERKQTFAWLQTRRSDIPKIMLHLIWYIIVGFLAGCVAKALLHTHLSITWTIVLGIVGSIIGGAVTHLFYPPSAGGRFHLGGLIVSILGAILVLYLWHKFRLHVPRG
jgi:uncharacterized membrane protein YeaQ/YmgE (transglycosylase-associated protein family)